MNTNTTGQEIILVVDDTPINLEILFEFLNNSGFKVLIAENGESAIQKANYASPDLILLDILMPGIDGFETCRRLKESELTKSIPVIFLTALTETVDKIRGFNLGAVDFITKPLQYEEVLARVKTHLSLQALTKQLQERNTLLEQEIQVRQQIEKERLAFWEREQVARAEAEAARNQAARILESITDAFFALDQEWRVTYLNPQAERLLQRSRADLLGKCVWNEFPETIGSTFEQEYHKAVSEQVSVAFEEFYAPLNTWFEVHAYPSTDGLSVYFQNISERKRVEKALRQQNLRSQLFAEVTLKIRQSLQIDDILRTVVTEVQRILQADRILIYQLGPDGTGGGVAEAVVPGLPQLLGQTFPEEVFPEESQQQYRQGRIREIADVEEDDQIPLCLVQFVRRFQVRAKLVVPVLAKEELWGLLIAHQCTGPRVWSQFETELLQQLADQLGIALMQAQLLEQETLQRQELTRSNIELQQFAYIASHDLQEPLRMVTSYLQLLERRYKGKLDADADDFIGYAVDGAARMRTLITDLLAYSRIGTRGQAFELINCSEIVNRAIDNLKVTIGESGAVIACEELPSVKADPTQLTQLFQNLIGNAIKFRREDPPVIHIRASLQQGAWLFSVQDNGIGIDPEYAERIFVIFQRLHNRVEYAGTGIGLAVCKKIVERHGGRIWVQSELGRGATFYFEIPNEGKV
ncbi:ATP-binding protein [Leptolyngbya sp. FACHB-261]|uniref:ATP-binding protein n=1 Tax=Leptolyngbya sp. FACHB-261 TaxID=2692806 RepID=UPI001688379B|nr:ATP-binding protein [Leptolyngbya sp. FACHB-261]MBD2102481.1 response regulator [Leptolyngbya sp. FACHB-261]